MGQSLLSFNVLPPDASRKSRFLSMTVACLMTAGTLVIEAGLNTAFAVGIMRAHAFHQLPGHIAANSSKSAAGGKSFSSGHLPHRPAYAARFALQHQGRPLTKKQLKALALLKEKQAKVNQKTAAANKTYSPQNFADDLVSTTVAPGVVHKFCRNPLNIHMIDIDMERAPVKVQPYLASESFDKLKDVADHARSSNALAAINANYFKKDGTPLGTLIIDGEWVAGPIYDRVAMGIARDGKVKIDRVSLNGLLTATNRDDLGQIWVNNINQPRRTGSRLVAYTRRWGTNVHMDYAGCLVAVNAQGEVVDKTTTAINIPYGGYVLSDGKSGAIAQLERGDKLQLNWQTRPDDWHDIVEAVSGGPMLVKDGKLFLDCKDENFKSGWTGAQIQARTVVGVTRDNHLLLVTIEGHHTLWDCAKFLYKMGAVDAMNLDGGGSTQMIIKGQRVTHCSQQRRVAASIVVLDTRTASLSHKTIGVPGDPQMPPVIQATSESAEEPTAIAGGKELNTVLTAGDPNAGKMKLLPPMEIAPDLLPTPRGYSNSYAPNGIIPGSDEQ
ncbi:MAG: phosphodiester glycosidase family protein [Candidatus Obscuribacterales bacterium]|nr:phosphodiester glycosidase family protein [Candidatus Obscuribacterales bacterium]